MSSFKVNPWKVAWACSLLMSLNLGIARIGGLLFVEAMDFYEVNRSQASFPFFFCLLMKCLGGPLAGYLSNQFGAYNVTLLGSIIASFGIGACFFAPNITMVLLFWGGVLGCGMALDTSLFSEFINEHFARGKVDRPHGLVYGVTGVAGTLLPLIGYSLLKKYGLPGTFLVFSSICLNSIPLCMYLKYSSPSSRVKNKQETIKTRFTEQPVISVPSRKQRCLEQYICLPCGGCKSLNEHALGTKDQFAEKSRSKLSPNDITDTNCLNTKDTPTIACFHSKRTDVHDRAITPEILEVPERKPIEDVRFLTTTQESSILGNNRSLKVLWNPVYVLIHLCLSTLYFIAQIMYAIIIDYGRDKGLATEEEIILLTCMSVTDISGRLTVGWVTDSVRISRVKFISFSFAALVLPLLGLVACYRLPMLLFMAGIYGVISGGIVIVFPGVINEFIIDESERKIALASRTTFAAFYFLITSSLIGFFRETLGSYDLLIYFIATISFICSFLMYLIPIVHKKLQQRDAVKNAIE